MTPFGASLYASAMDSGVPAMAETLGLMIKAMDTKVIGLARPKGPNPPAWLLARVLPPLRRRALPPSSPASVAGRSELTALRLRLDDRASAVPWAWPADPVAALAEVDAELAAELEHWFAAHGWRTANYDAGSVALAERHGLPAVLGAHTATTSLRDGQLVTVDGTAGTVTLAG